MKLTSDNVLWFVYQYNCSVGHSTFIPRRAFVREFSAKWGEIEPIVKNLVEVEKLIKRFGRIYDLTERGLQKAQAMSEYMPTDVAVFKRFWIEIAQYLISLFERS